jgi:hypothetical protein
MYPPFKGTGSGARRTLEKDALQQPLPFDQRQSQLD